MVKIGAPEFWSVLKDVVLIVPKMSQLQVKYKYCGKCVIKKTIMEALKANAQIGMSLVKYVMGLLLCRMSATVVSLFTRISGYPQRQ